MDKINEKNVAGLWMSGKLASFSDDLGNRIEVICPGRTSTRPGCDFQDAVIRVNRQKVVGDIEVHVTSDLWLKHGHHKDPACNGVILHVALWQKGGLPVKLQDGRVLPTVILGQHIINIYGAALRRREARVIRPCLHGGGNSRMTDTILLIEGLRRLEERAADYAEALKTAEAAQVLYKGICRAFGYTRNKAPFEALADRLPLPLIFRLAGNSLTGQQALLLGAAGLLPSQSELIKEWGSMYNAVELESEWGRLSANILPGRVSDWSLTLVRPVNHPVRRIIALSYLLQRYGENGLLPGIKRLAGSAGAVKSLAAGLQINEDYSLAGQRDSGRSQGRHTALIGRGRAGEIAINVVLPFFTALARHDKDARLENRVLNTYLRHPALPANELTRYMSGVLQGRRNGKLNACRQQGLIRLYQRYCRVKDCECCPVFISRRKARA